MSSCDIYFDYQVTGSYLLLKILVVFLVTEVSGHMDSGKVIAKDCSKSQNLEGKSVNIPFSI